MRRRGYVFLALAAALWAGCSSRPGGAPSSGSAAPRQPAPGHRWQGVASCSASACHGGGGPPGSWGSEYTTWVARDPHARAYEVLYDGRSQGIIKALGWKEPAHREGRCLACHVGPSWQEAQANPRFSLEDGVGCEACHGPAGRWLTEHYRKGWGRRGMNDTKSLVGRAATCVGCHVGGPAGDVNHDLIAAGHPRLNFEFGAYHANLPHHWDDAKDKDPARGGRRDFEAAAWAVGQVASAEAALELLAYRAGAAAKEPARQPWPEFAEYDCFACHHDLKAESWRQSREHYGKRTPGALPWGDWYYSMTTPALAALEGKADRPFADALTTLRRQMERPYPSREKVLVLAPLAARALAPRLQARRQGPDRVLDAPALFGRFLTEARERAPTTWDAAAQSYLALGALRQAARDVGSRRAGADLRRLEKALRFPAGFASPRTFSPR